MGEPKGSDKTRLVKGAALYGSMGLDFGLSVVVGFFIGRTLDGWLDTSPYLMIVFIVVGALAGFKRLYELTKRAMASAREVSDSEAGEHQESK